MRRLFREGGWGAGKQAGSQWVLARLGDAIQTQRLASFRSKGHVTGDFLTVKAEQSVCRCLCLASASPVGVGALLTDTLASAGLFFCPRVPFQRTVVRGEFECGPSTEPVSVEGDRSALRPSGLRLGTPALTSRGLLETEFQKVAHFIHKGKDIRSEA